MKKNRIRPRPTAPKFGNDLGLHARAAAKLARLAGEFESQITVALVDLDRFPGVSPKTEADGKSITSLLMLAAAKGRTLEVRARGKDAAAAAGGDCATCRRRLRRKRMNKLDGLRVSRGIAVGRALTRQEGAAVVARRALRKDANRKRSRALRPRLARRARFALRFAPRRARRDRNHGLHRFVFGAVIRSANRRARRAISFASAISTPNGRWTSKSKRCGGIFGKSKTRICASAATTFAKSPNGFSTR